MIHDYSDREVEPRDPDIPYTSFIQIAAAHTTYGHILYALDADGAVWEYDRLNSYWYKLSDRRKQ